MLQPGSRLGRYEIRSLLGAGGMGEVYLAHDTQLLRPVALKVLAAALRADEELRERLEYEARAASALNHPNILTVYDIGEEDDRRFIATEFVDGMTLRQHMMRATPTAFEVVHIGAQIASALAAAEAAGLVHRDVKPDNVMLRRDGYVKLLDFGLARATTASDPARQTDPYVVRGTVYYMSPEQLRGMSVDTRSDIWSLGVLLYELLTGLLPFDGDTPSDIVAAILRNDVPPLNDEVPARLREIVAGTLEKDLENRYQTAHDLFRDLDELRRSGLQAPEAASEFARPTSPRYMITERVRTELTPVHNFPASPGPIVGREGELHEVVSMVRRPDVRLLTLTGPGGTGKTRLSLAAGAELVRDFEHGAFFVSLAPIRDPRLVVQEIADTLGITEGGIALLESVKKFLRDKSMLLILDNFEQITDAAPVIAEIMNAAPLVKFLATSRAPLHIRGEREYAVPPLVTPPADAGATPDELMRYASVALFVERASRVKSDFVMTPDNARAIADLCVRLEGLPLAIELAAARVKLLPPQAMLARVGNRLQFLAGGPRDLPERQQTMRAAISWGYNLLDDGEKRLFEDLSVFRGGLSLSQAEAIGGADLLDQLSSLVDKSFIRRDADHSEDEPRFTMLETIRDYGIERLAASGRDDDVRRAHATLMAAIAEASSADSEKLAVDHDNFRAALEWAIAAREASIALRLAGALWWLWYLHGHYAEGRRWLDDALALPGQGEHAARAKALCGAGALALLQCDYNRATELLDASIELARGTADRRSLAQSLQFRGSIARERGEYHRAIDLHELSLTIWRELDDLVSAGRSMNYIAFSSWLNCDFRRAVELCRETLPLFRDRGDNEGVAWSLLNLAASEFYAGDSKRERVEHRLEDALSWSRVGGFKEGVAWSLNLLGLVVRARGERDRATSLLRDSLQLHWELGDRWRSASVIEQLAALANERDDPALASRLYGAAEALRSRLGTPVPPVELPQYEHDVAALRVRGAAIDVDWDRGIAGSIEDAVNSVLQTET